MGMLYMLSSNQIAEFLRLLYLKKLLRYELYFLLWVPIYKSGHTLNQSDYKILKTFRSKSTCYQNPHAS